MAGKHVEQMIAAYRDGDRPERIRRAAQAIIEEEEAPRDARSSAGDASATCCRSRTAPSLGTSPRFRIHRWIRSATCRSPISQRASNTSAILY